MAARAATRRLIALVATVVLLTAVVGYAGWVVVYQLGGQVTEVQPPVYFAGGTNNGTTGLGGGTIYVDLGPNQTSATVYFNVTYGTTWVIDLLNITNSDTTTYYGKLCVATPISSATGVVSSAYAIVVDPTTNTVVGYVDLLTAGACTATFTIPAGGNLTVDFNTTLSEGTQLDTAPLSFTLTLQYSAENPVPTTP